MFQIGDIVKDISPEYADCDFTGIIVDAVVILGFPVFHVRFFDSDDGIITLHPHEIQKVS
jgi:hypothetical protein